MNNKIWASVVVVVVAVATVWTIGAVDGRPQENPCAALGLRLCVLKKDAAAGNGRPSPIRQPPIRRPEPEPEVSSGDAEKVELVYPQEQEDEPDLPKQRFPEKEAEDNSGCAGLPLCVLSKNSGGAKRARPFSTTPEPVQEPVFELSGSGESLLSTVLNGDTDTALRLIEEGADVNSADAHGNSVLHIAAQNGRADVIDALLLEGADVNKGNNHQNTALHLAAQNGFDEVVAKLLRAKKINANKKDLHANSALHLAAQNGQNGVARLLIDHGVEVNSVNSHKHIPLHLAAQNGHLELSKMLIDAGSDLDSADLIGNTPLHTAYHTTHNNIAQLLIASGADQNKANSSGLKPAQLGK